MKTWKTPQGTELQIMGIKGKDYLQVAQRLIWFREEHPDWGIETSITYVGDHCIAEALIKDPQGRIVSMSHKYEDKQGFPDFIEKAETGAIGRALALLGYGTQFCADELDEGDRLADSPIAKPNPHAPKNMQPGEEDGFNPANPEYRVPFGKFNKKGLREIPTNELETYVGYLENKARLENKPIQGQVLEFITRAKSYISDFPAENAKLLNDLN